MFLDLLAHLVGRVLLFFVVGNVIVLFQLHNVKHLVVRAQVLGEGLERALNGLADTCPQRHDLRGLNKNCVEERTLRGAALLTLRAEEAVLHDVRLHLRHLLRDCDGTVKQLQDDLEEAVERRAVREVPVLLLQGEREERLLLNGVGRVGAGVGNLHGRHVRDLDGELRYLLYEVGEGLQRVLDKVVHGVFHDVLDRGEESLQLGHLVDLLVCFLHVEPPFADGAQVRLDGVLEALAPVVLQVLRHLIHLVHLELLKLLQRHTATVGQVEHAAEPLVLDDVRALGADGRQGSDDLGLRVVRVELEAVVATRELGLVHRGGDDGDGTLVCPALLALLMHLGETHAGRQGHELRDVRVARDLGL
eukprot:PhM_4_TR17401/c0_g1_i1/m.82125